MQPPPDDIDLLALWAILWSNKWVITATVGLALLTGAIYLVVAEPVYRASAVMVEASSGRPGGAAALLGQFGGLASLAGVDVGALADTRSDGLTLIQSRTFAEEFIARNDLLPALFPDLDESAEPPTLSRGASRLRDVTELLTDRETGLLTLRVEWTDPDLAADWANGLVEFANQMARERDIADAERSVAYLEGQIAATNVVELQRVLYGLLEVEQRTLMLANAREEYVFEFVDPALRPGSPAKPKPIIILALSTFLGLVIGFIVVYFRAVIGQLGRYPGTRTP